MKVLLVDLDDTLLDYTGGVDESWAEACEAVAAPAGVDPQPLTAAIAASRRWFWGDPDRHRRERTDMMGAWTKIAAGGLERLGVAADGLASAIAEDFAARRRAVMRLFPGVVPSLERLHRRGVRLGLVTNGDRRQQRDKIERFDLARFFGVIVIEGEFGVGKPDEAVYRHALDTLGATVPDAWMVGDNLDWDVGAPQRLGLRGVWVDGAGRGLPPGSAVQPDQIIRAFPELVGAGD